jgi:hypothetical protein
MHVRRIVIIGAAALALAAGGTAAGAAVAGPVGGDGTSHGCYTNQNLNGSHVFVLQDAEASCPTGTTAISWNQQGPAGPADKITSPNGEFSIDVTDTGIVLAGPTSKVTIDIAGVAVKGGTVTIAGDAHVSVRGGNISLNGCNAFVARRGDTINTSELSVGPAPGPVLGTAKINQGSPNVCTG